MVWLLSFVFFIWAIAAWYLLNKFVLNLNYAKISSTAYVIYYDHIDLVKKKGNFEAYKNSEGPDHSRSLIRTFVVHLTNHWLL